MWKSASWCDFLYHRRQKLNAVREFHLHVRHCLQATDKHNRKQQLSWVEQCVNSTSTSDTVSRLQTSTTETNSWVELSSAWIPPPRQTLPPGYRQAQQKTTAELSWAVREFHLHVRHRLQTTDKHNRNQQLSWDELRSAWIPPPRQTPPPGYRQAQQKPIVELSWAVCEFHLHVRHCLQATDKHNRNQQLSWVEQCANSTSTSDTASRLQTSTTETNSWVELSSVWIPPPRQTLSPGYRQAQQKPTADLSWARFNVTLNTV